MRSTAALLLFATAETSGLAISRRRFVAAAAPLVAAAPALAAPAEADLVQDLVRAKASLEELPKMVGEMSWDAVRNELRQPAVNALWNSMDSGNTLRKLAKARGDGEIIEAAEDVARNLRDVDQMVYSNAFSMEGNICSNLSVLSKSLLLQNGPIIRIPSPLSSASTPAAHTAAAVAA